MKAIVHIGMPKAGSTALQRGLSSVREQLLDSSILYPTSPGMRDKHGLLIHGLTNSKPPRYLRHKYKEDFAQIGRDYESWLSSIHRTISKKKPEILLLSDEELFKVDHEDDLIELGARLRELADVVEVVAYVRRPSARYLSAVQQVLKASHRVRPIAPAEYRKTLDGYAKFIADEINVFEYDRAEWPGGDILRHYLDTFVPDAEVEIADRSGGFNSSLSAEAMAILAAYREEHWRNDNNRFTPDTQQLLRALSTADTHVAGERSPRLHEHVQHALDHGSPDVLWLKDEYGVVFDGIDYSEISRAPVDLKGIPQPRKVEDICPIDDQRKSRLAIHAMYQLGQQSARGDATK